MLDEAAYAELDARLAPLDAESRLRSAGEQYARQPIHTLVVPADLFGPGVLREYGRLVRRTVAELGPLPFEPEIIARVLDKLDQEPVEDLRIDFADGYGVRDDDEEDAAARRTAQALRPGDRPPFLGLRCKSLDGATRRRAVRTLDVFLDALESPPPGFVMTVPKVSTVEQVDALVVLCGRLEAAHGLAEHSLRFELQVETPTAVIGPDGVATVARLIHAAAGRCAGLLYGTEQYSTAVGVAAEYASLDHPTAEHAKAVLQVVAAGAEVRLAEATPQILPVGDAAAVQAAWAVHAQQVRRSLLRGIYHGWDQHPALLPSRFGATYTFFRQAGPSAVDRLGRDLARPGSGRAGDNPGPGPVPAPRAGLRCLDDTSLGLDRSTLEKL